jgi:steroid 5-alpha reductase family enzyme
MKGYVIALVLVAIVIALAIWGNPTGALVGDLPFMAIIAAGVFVIQWLGLVHASAFTTERYYDLVGSLTYISVVLIALAFRPHITTEQWLIAGCIVVWAARLGSFLFRRVLAVGEDQRFREIKKSTPRFLVAWTLQGVWVFITSSAGVAAILTPNPNPLPAVFIVGLALWVIGFAVEVIADNQKQHFRQNPANAGNFIQSGLWTHSQHPNYFGEIVLWIGVAVMAITCLEGASYVFLLSPLLVILLLTRVSGIPTLRRTAKARWGDDPEYQAYCKNSPVLVPRLRPR